jgi:hypothetical protein
MKLNLKQIIYRNKCIQAYTNKLRLKMLAFTMLAFLGMAAFAFALNPTEQSFNDLSKVGGGTGITYALIVGATSIPAASNAAKQGNQLNYKIYYITESQWDETAGFPDLINETRSTVPLKDGEKWHYLGSVDDTAEVGINAEAGDIASAIGNDIKFVVGGIEAKLRKFLRDGLGEKFFIVVKAEFGEKMYIGGNGTKPMKLKSFTGGMGKENTSFELTFENKSLFTWDEYVGALPIVEPVIVAADATAVALTADAELYKITGGTAAPVNIIEFTGMTEAHNLKVVELVGMGGDHPATIDDDDDFLLMGGTTWTAAVGARISFQIYKTGVGTWKFIEVPGSRYE